MEKSYKKRILFIGMPDMALVCLSKLKEKGIKLTDREKIAEYRAEKQKLADEEKARIEAEAKAKAEEEARLNPSEKELLKEIRDLLKANNTKSKKETKKS